LYVKVIILKKSWVFNTQLFFFLFPKTGVTLKENPPVSLQKQNENCKVQIAKSFSPSFRSCSGIGGIGVKPTKYS